MSDRHFILGTAGHIDHGKTALVKALTNVDTDRLKEERERGLTIDIGFAHMGENATIIDVPGHEKFIKNMVAGVSTIDLVLFVIAADDGVMPQTREHLDILNILQIRGGVIVITKKDLVDEEWLELVTEDVRELVRDTILENAEIVAVSAIENEGVAELKQKIDAFLAKLPPRHDRGVFWLPVDRCFSMHGFGTVVTGSLLSGKVAVGDVVDILPRGEKARVRGLQKHGASSESAATGDRAAINLQGVDKENVQRGDVLATSGYFKSSRRIHGKVKLLKDAIPLKLNTRVRLHIGTAEVMARTNPIGAEHIPAGGEGYVQFTLEESIAVRRLDPFVLRQYSPQRTIGGGVVLDANAKPFRRKDENAINRLRGLEKEEPEELIAEQFLAAEQATLSVDDLVRKTGMSSEMVKPVVEGMIEKGAVVALSKKSFTHAKTLESLQRQALRILEEFHLENPIIPGLKKAELPQRLAGRILPHVAQFVFDRLGSEGLIKEIDGLVALSNFSIRLPEKLEPMRAKIDALLYDQAYATQSPSELAATVGVAENESGMILAVLLAQKKAVRFDGDIFIHAKRLEEAKLRLIDFLRENGQITVPQFKELVQGATRKFALPLLNYFDAKEITVRNGDIRLPGGGIE